MTLHVEWWEAVGVILSIFALVYKVGGFATRIEIATARVEPMAERLERIPVLENKLDLLGEMLAHHVGSDHRELGRRLDAIAGTATRAAQASGADFPNGGSSQ